VPEQRAASGARVRLVEASTERAVERADEVVDELLEGGHAPQDVLVLTTGEAHPWQQHEMSFGAEPYWQQLAEGADVFYADALMEREVRRAVVVLAVNGGGEAHAASALPVALGRAGTELVVCGDPQRLAAMLGTGQVPAPAPASA
jgi:hypothetical protein